MYPTYTLNSGEERNLARKQMHGVRYMGAGSKPFEEVHVCLMVDGNYQQEKNRSMEQLARP